jgi:hypothetical protein
MPRSESPRSMPAESRVTHLSLLRAPHEPDLSFAGLGQFARRPIDGLMSLVSDDTANKAARCVRVIVDFDKSHLGVSSWRQAATNHCTKSSSSENVLWKG